MLRRLRRLRVSAIFYTCGGLCAILLLVNFNEDVKRLLQQSSSTGGPHLSLSSSSGSQFLHNHLHQSSAYSSALHGPPPQPPAHPPPPGGGPFNPRKYPGAIPQNSVDENVISLNAKVRKRNPPRKEGEIDDVNPDPSSPFDSSLLENGEEKPWYMWGGTRFPSLSSGVPSTSVDEARLWYEDNLNNDRILEQLMFWIDDPINNPNSSLLWYPESSSSGSGSDTTHTLSTVGSPNVNNVNANTGSSSGDGQFKKTTGPLEEGTGVETDDEEKDEDFLSSVAISTGSVQLISGGGGKINNNDNNSSPAATSGSGGGRFPSGGPRKGKLKTILLYYGLGMSWGSHITSGRSVFLQQKCPVNACRLSGNRAHLAKADLVLFKDVFMNPKIKRNPAQLWIMYMLECPLNTQNFVDKNVFNLTATYRHDSDIVTPYEKWVYYDDNAKTLEQGVNYAEGKTKKVAWFVSNCVAKNNRLDYARELAKYIDVDIYGACGTHSCSRANAKQCFELLAKNYKFYLAFENSNCRDYISEKFFVNGLGNNVLPIVMGAHPNDYKRVAPAKSYIHVDDFATPKELAEYLYLLDKNNELYNEYFQWKGTGEFINTHFFCRLCAMAHYADKSERKPRHYKDFNKWWRGPNVCTRRSWRNQPDIFSPQYYERPTEDN